MKKINVLQFICPTGFYGAEMWIMALAKNLNREKVKCRLVITLESKEQDIEICNRFKALGFDSYQIQMHGRFDFIGILKLARLLKKDKIDIIHTHGYKSETLGLIAARLSGIKAVATPHGFENVPDFKLQAFIRLGSFALKYLDRVVPLSEELQSDMHRIKVNPEKIRLITNGLDLDEIELARQEDLSEPKNDPLEKRIGYVGQIAHRKNLDDLLKAFELLYKDHKNIRLLVIGDGPKREELEKIAKSLTSYGKVEFMGYREDRLKIVKELDLFCMTSSLEGIPRCMMEAMALEVPVAAFNIPGVDKLIIHKETGLMAPFGHVEELKNCMERLLFDGDFSRQVAQNAKKHIEENFSAKRMADEYTSLYQELVAESIESSA